MATHENATNAASTQSILIVEDEGVVAMEIRNRLGGLGYRVAGWATNGEDAIAKAIETRPDLVLMDIRLKGAMDGIEAAERIQATLPVPVVFLTAFDDDDTLRRAKGTDLFGYLLKPLSERELRTTIEIALYKHRLDTALRAANRELEAQTAFLDALFQSVPCSVLVVGTDRRVRMANRHFRRSFGVDGDEIYSWPVGEVLGCDTSLLNLGACGQTEDCSACGVNRPVLEALEGRPTERHRSQFTRRRGSQLSRMTFLTSAAPLEFHGERLAILILEDITELAGLRELLSPERSFAGIVGSSRRMREVYETIREVADLTVPVMILGESGTGKELVARAIHDRGSRSRGEFVPVNCGALPDGLLESELFGHVKGAFTGAIRDRKGRFELAQGGTIFLDEVGELSPTMQVKLLRVLQEGTFERVGSERTSTTDARVICATNRDIEREVAEGRFREDLYYRLCVMPIRLPPLRERLEDVPRIAEHLVAKEIARSGGRQVSLSDEAVSRFMEHDWPGNVRELQNALTHAFIKCKGSRIGPEHLPPGLAAGVRQGGPIRRPTSGLTVEAVAAALAATGGNKVNAAKELGVSRATLYRFLAEHPHLYDAQ